LIHEVAAYVAVDNGQARRVLKLQATLPQLLVVDYVGAKDA
jgi:hypothetical protein